MYPSQASANKLWAVMPRETRLVVAGYFLDQAKEVTPTYRRAVFAVLAKARNSRESSIRKASPEQQVNWLTNCQTLPADFADALIRVYLLGERKPLIQAFLKELNIPNEDGIIEEGFDCTTLSTETLTAAARKLQEEFGSEATELYLAYAAGTGGDWAEALARIPLPLPE